MANAQISTAQREGNTRSTFIYTLFVTCLLSFVTAANAQTEPRQVAFLKGVEVRVNGSMLLRFGVDTGAAPAFFITPEHAAKLSLPVVGHRVIHTPDNPTTSATESAELVRMQTLEVAGHIFVAPTGVALPDSQRDGTLGISLFRDVLLTLDYPQDRLSISKGELPDPNGQDVIAYTTHPEAKFAPLRVSPTVPVQLAGRPFQALLDTGARKLPADIVVPTAIAATLPLGPKESETMISGVSGRSFPAYTAKLNGNLVLGSFVLRHPTVLVSDWLGFVDLGRVINCLAVTIDQRNQRLRIEAPQPSPCLQR